MRKAKSGWSKTTLAAGILACSGGLVTECAQAGPTFQFGDQGSLTVSYALQPWLQERGYTSSTNSASTTDAFLRRNRLTFSGQYNDMVGFYAQLEAGNDGKSGQVDKSVYYRDAYITLDYRDDMRFIVGRFKNTFSRENLEACLEPLTLDRAEVLSYTPYAGTRDTGAVVWGNLMDAKLQYRVMLGNGRDSDVMPEHKARLTTRVHYSFLDPEYNYGYLGTYLGTAKVLTVGAAYDSQPKVAYGNYASRTDPKDYKAWTADVFFEYPTSSGVYTASAAYFKYDTGGAINENPDPELPVTSDLKGYYVKAGYMLPNKVGIGRLQFFGRHERSDYAAKTGIANYYDQKWNGLGLNYYIDGQRLKVTFEYDKITFDTQHPTNPALQDYTQSTLGLQLIF